MSSSWSRSRSGGITTPLLLIPNYPVSSSAKYAPSLYHQLRARHEIPRQIEVVGYRLRRISKRWQVFGFEIEACHRAPWTPRVESIPVSRERDANHLIERLQDGGEEGDQETISTVGINKL